MWIHGEKLLFRPKGTRIVNVELDFSKIIYQFSRFTNQVDLNPRNPFIKNSDFINYDIESDEELDDLFGENVESEPEDNEE